MVNLIETFIGPAAFFILAIIFFLVIELRIKMLKCRGWLHLPWGFNYLCSFFRVSFLVCIAMLRSFAATEYAVATFDPYCPFFLFNLKNRII